MDLPDKIYIEGDIKLWRPEAIVMRLSDTDVFNDYRFENPVPVYSGDLLVGSATLEIRGKDIHASLFVDYEIPERLEAEEGLIWALPRVTTTHFIRATNNETGEERNFPSVTKIDSLQLRKDCYLDLPALGKPLL
jgi:hypothetical protein